MTHTAVKFILHMQCENCMRNVSRVVVVPPLDDAPLDIDDLLESEFLRRQTFQCVECDSVIAVIVGVTQPKEVLAA